MRSHRQSSRNTPQHAAPRRQPQRNITSGRKTRQSVVPKIQKRQFTKSASPISSYTPQSYTSSQSVQSSLRNMMSNTQTFQPRSYSTLSQSFNTSPARSSLGSLVGMSNTHSLLRPSTMSMPNMISPLTLPARFGSGGKNKQNLKSKFKAEHDRRRRSRNHSSSWTDPFPKMTLAVFRRLPRPAFLESDTLNLFIPAPQLDREANQREYELTHPAVQQPY